MTVKEQTIICAKCWAEVIKRSVNHTLCMKCVMDVHQQKIKELYDLDMRNMKFLSTREPNDKEIKEANKG